MLKSLRRWQFGYAPEDMRLLKLKIASGLTPGEANMNKFERRALCDIPDDELWKIAYTGAKMRGDKCPT